MTRQAHLKKLKEAIEQGKHPMQQPLEKRQKRAQKVANRIIELAEEAK
ncbi:MAG: hypothetical protein ACHQAX_01350 [Gammaproteobacteria bacterium]